MPELRCVTFDWGDTLACNRGAAYHLCLERGLDHITTQLRKRSTTIPAGWVAKHAAAIEAHFASSGNAELAPDHREVEANLALATALRQLAIDEAEHDALLEGFYAHFIDALVPFQGVAETLHALHERGLRIGILSHVPFDGRACRAWFARQGLASAIDFYSLSSDIGWIKPHPSHYRHACDLAGCAAEAILHVGDHPERDIIGARDFSMRTCLKVTEHYYPRSSLDSCGADYRIAHVKELLPIVQSF